MLFIAEVIIFVVAIAFAEIEFRVKFIFEIFFSVVSIGAEIEDIVLAIELLILAIELLMLVSFSGIELSHEKSGMLFVARSDSFSFVLSICLMLNIF
jgi:hypothetical protein